jgi:predicted Zn-dependent protease
MIDPQAVAARVVEMVGDRAEAQAAVAAGESSLTRFANSFIHQNVSESTNTVTLKIAADGRVATGTDNRTDDDSLRALADRTLEAARLSPTDLGWPGMAPPADVPEIDNHDEATVAATPETRAAIVKDFVDAGGGMEAAGYCDTDALTVGFANSLGHTAVGRETRASLDGIHRTATSAGSGHRTSSRIGELDGAAVGELAADRACRGVDPYDVKPGEYEVVLAPECVATIAIFLAFYGFNGKQVEEGQSFVDLGAQQFDPRISLCDDAAAPGALGLPFDAEGTPKARLDLISGGVTSGVAHDRRTAAKAGVASTGNGMPANWIFGPLPTNLRLAEGAESVDDMIAGVDRGLYVATFNYCRVLDPKTQVVTGLTRNGTFMIENGAITGAVTNLRFTQSFVAALGPDRVLGVGDDARFADSEFGPGLVWAPSLRLAGWNFTGGAAG